MATATAEPVVSAPSTDHLFISRRSELTLVMTRSKRVVINGEEVDTDYGHTIAFVDGQLRIPRKGWVTDTQGDRVPTKDVLAFLEGTDDRPPHRMLNNREEGFWRHVEPAPAPTEEEGEAVVVYAEEGNVAGLEDLIAQEEAGWHRESFLKLARGSLQRTKARQEKPKAEAKPEAKAG